MFFTINVPIRTFKEKWNFVHWLLLCIKLHVLVCVLSLDIFVSDCIKFVITKPFVATPNWIWGIKFAFAYFEYLHKIWNAGILI